MNQLKAFEFSYLNFTSYSCQKGGDSPLIGDFEVRLQNKFEVVFSFVVYVSASPIGVMPICIIAYEEPQFFPVTLLHKSLYL